MARKTQPKLHWDPPFDPWEHVCGAVPIQPIQGEPRTQLLALLEVPDGTREADLALLIVAESVAWYREIERDYESAPSDANVKAALDILSKPLLPLWEAIVQMDRRTKAVLVSEGFDPNGFEVLGSQLLELHHALGKSRAWAKTKTKKKSGGRNYAARDQILIPALCQVFNGYHRGDCTPAELLDRKEEFVALAFGYAGIPSPTVKDTSSRGEEHQGRLRRLIKKYEAESTETA